MLNITFEHFIPKSYKNFRILAFTVTCNWQKTLTCILRRMLRVVGLHTRTVDDHQPLPYPILLLYYTTILLQSSPPSYHIILLLLLQFASSTYAAAAR